MIVNEILDQVDSLASAMRLVNGRRRARTVDAKDVVDVADGLEESEVKLLHGGRVANNYRFAAWATAVLVFRIGGRRFALPRLVSGSTSTGFGDLIRGLDWRSDVDLDELPDREDVIEIPSMRDWAYAKERDQA